jgi:8-amino-7-oxononanoate synthase
MLSNHYKQELDSLNNQGLLRTLPHNYGTDIENLCSNDYLSINDNQELYNEFLKSLKKEKFTFSSSASRLLSQKSTEHHKLELTISKLYNKESSLLFNSGYHANVGTISALCNKRDLIIADKYVHASIIDGVKLSEADFKRYRHLDYSHLENILKKHRNEYDNVFIITESIFSMDGDIANLEKLVEIKQKHKACLYIDEAHAIGTRGKTGLGICEEQNQIENIDIIVATFGKALASIGAFVSTSKPISQYLVNKSRSFIYSTALPPINIAWTHFIIKELKNMSKLRGDLEYKSQHFAKLFKQTYKSNIIPYMVGNNNVCIKLSEDLLKKGYNVLPIRYPTVPKNTARLRFSICSNTNKTSLITLYEYLTKTK